MAKIVESQTVNITIHSDLSDQSFAEVKEQLPSTGPIREMSLKTMRKLAAAVTHLDNATVKISLIAKSDSAQIATTKFSMQLKVVWDLATFPPRNPNSMNLNELALSTRLRSLFKRDLGIQLVSELLERGAERLLEIPRFGKRELGYLRRKLRAHGLYLSGEGPVHASE